MATMHGVRRYQDLMRGIRAAIEAGTFADFREAFRAARAPRKAGS